MQGYPVPGTNTVASDASIKLRRLSMSGTLGHCAVKPGFAGFLFAAFIPVTVGLRITLKVLDCQFIVCMRHQLPEGETCQPHAALDTPYQQTGNQHTVGQSDQRLYHRIMTEHIRDMLDF